MNCNERYQRFHYSVSGVSAIEEVSGIENVDLSDLIERVSSLVSFCDELMISLCVCFF